MKLFWKVISKKATNAKAKGKNIESVNENESFSSSMNFQSDLSPILAVPTTRNDACYIPSTVHSLLSSSNSNETVRNDWNIPSNSVTLLNDSSKKASTGTGCSMSTEDSISMSSSSVSPSDVSNNFDSNCMPMKTRMMKPILQVAEIFQQFCFQLVLCIMMCVMLLSIFLSNLFQLTSNSTSRSHFHQSVSSGCGINSGTHSIATSSATNLSQAPSNLSFSSKSVKSDISSSKTVNSSKKKLSHKCKTKGKKKGAVGQEKMPSNPKPSSNQSSNQSVSSDCKLTYNSGTLRTSSSTYLFPVHSNISLSSNSPDSLVSSEINSSHKQEKKRKKKGPVSQEITSNRSADPKPVLQCSDIR